MKSLDTHYRGKKFRSRLEAKYAVFFDQLGIKWVYEPQGYLLSNGECYLPDFWLPNFNGGMWVEVKPEKLNPQELEKCRLLCKESKHHVWLAVEEPDFRCYEMFYYWDDEVVEGEGVPLTDKAEHENRMFVNSGFGKPGELMSKDYIRCASPILKTAVKIAKEARFEHGEKP